MEAVPERFAAPSQCKVANDRFEGKECARRDTGVFKGDLDAAGRASYTIGFG